jgi:hypothetical protein
MRLPGPIQGENKEIQNILRNITHRDKFVSRQSQFNIWHLLRTREENV